MVSRGHNSGENGAAGVSSDPGGIAADHLRSFVDRVERLAEEREALSADIREIYAEAKGNGFDVAILRKVIAIRRLDTSEYQEQRSLVDLYLSAIDPLS